MSDQEEDSFVPKHRLKELRRQLNEDRGCAFITTAPGLFIVGIILIDLIGILMAQLIPWLNSLR